MIRTRGKKKLDYVNEVAIVKTPANWVILLVALILLIVLPYLLRWTGNNNWLTFINVTFITIIAVLGLNIITGMAGQVSLGHTAFVMVGAFATGTLMKVFNWPFWGALPVSALLAAVLGLIVGAPSLRLKGFYLAVATLAFLLIAQFVIRNLEVTGGIHGIIGIPSPALGTLKINDDIEWYYLIFAFLMIFTFFSLNLSRSRLGRAFLAVRDNDNAASSMGIQAYGTKLRAFFIGSLFAGVAGSLLACYLTVVRTDQSPFTIWDSIWYLGMVVIGGAGSTAGGIMGVIFLRLISQFLHMASMADWAGFVSNSVWINITSAVYGLAIVLFVSFQPYGLITIWEKIRFNYKRWPFGY
jgi:branched-chain amino acid transport system permease protein